MVAMERTLTQYEPFPLTVLDHHYHLIRANAGATRLFTSFVAEPALLAAQAQPNVFAALFDPRLVRPFVLHWEQVARAMVSRLHREVLTRSGDSELAALLNSL